MNSTDICNMALSSIGQGRIVSMEENSEAARQCKIYYNHLRQTLLLSFPWNFAARSVKLAKLEAEVPGWNEVYAYPNACLAIRQIYDRDGAGRKMDEYAEYSMAAVNDSTRVICTDIENAWADYTADIENAQLFSADFTEALMRGLASALAVPLSGSSSMQQSQYQMMQAALFRAERTSAIEEHHSPDYPTKYFDARQ